MEEVKTYRCLGVDILNIGRMSQELNHRIGDTRKTVGALVPVEKEAYV